MAVHSTRYKRHTEERLRAAERKEAKERDRTGFRFQEPAPPLLVRFTTDQAKLPAAIAIQLPHDTAIASLLVKGRSVPVGSFDAMPSLVVDDENLEHAGLNFAVV